MDARVMCDRLVSHLYSSGTALSPPPLSAAAFVYSPAHFVVEDTLVGWNPADSDLIIP